MSTSHLEQKTVRPGSLIGYSSYYSGRRQPKSAGAKPVARRHFINRVSILVALVVIIAAAVFATPLLHKATPSPQKTAASLAAKKTVAKASPPKTTAPAAVATPAAVNQCAGNTLDQLIVVSISQRHLWACQGATSVYDSPVVTGIDYLAADITPTGTYHIYSKQTNVTLRGSDSTGSWDDPVHYWMPWLNNQYGTYGFHDATWRPASAFGNISPDSSNASHGCVELPLQTAAWLYNWSSIGTTLTINS
jgi:lipoprotein-anchoring transpeptidase ErfK/SrfK